LYLADIAVSTGSIRRQSASAPPTMIEGPCRAPSAPPDTPMPTKPGPSPERLEAPHGVTEIGVSRIDDDVIVLHERLECRNLLVHRIAGLDHDDDRPWRFDRGHELLKRSSRRDPVGKSPCIGGKGFGPRCCAIVDSNVIAVVRDVERKICAHDAQSDHTYIRLRHARSHSSADLLGGSSAHSFGASPGVPQAHRRAQA
jgi:hypothetical protein